MFISYIKTTVKEIACGTTMIILSDLMFVFLPNEKVALTDFLYLNILLGVAFLIFWFIGYAIFQLRYKAIIVALKNEECIEQAVPTDSSFYSKIIRGILHKKAKEHQVEKDAYILSAKEKDEYMEQWIHEVKIPISVCELVLRDSENSNESNEKVIFEMERIKYLVNQVLYSARASDTSQSLDVSQFNIKNTVKQVIKANSLFFIYKNINIDFSLEDAFVTSDEKWISYIFTQIIHNTTKYSRESGNVRIWGDKAHNTFNVHIWNEGLGVRKEDIPKLFDKGFIGETGRQQTKSTGIGLYFAKRIADVLGVSIQISSIENQFAEFIISIPL